MNRKITRSMTVRFDPALRDWLDGIATEAEIVHEDGRPRDAELIRVLLVSGLIGGDAPIPARVLVALYCNGVLALSGGLAQSVRGLRGSLVALARKLAGGARRDVVDAIGFLAEAELTPTPRPGIGQDRARVHLILDDRLHKALIASAATEGRGPLRSGSPRRYAPGAAVIGRILTEVHDDFRNHRPVVMGYARSVRRLKDTIRAAVDAEREALLASIRTPSP